MRPSRSRRVQAQRKFAQGAYVPPNVVAVVAADNRRDAVQDPRNVTINNITATGLLDVVALQSADSSSDRSGHSHLTSQPVVIIERLQGRNLTRDVLPPPSQRETLETRPWEYPHERANNNVATIKKPAEPPKLQTVKKKKEYKQGHPMALRSRRPSKRQLNKLIAESCSPLRKVASKRKKHSSDEDEPLIFQKTRLKQTAAQQSTSIQTASRESAKENTLKPSSPKEKSPKNKPCKKRSKKEITTNEITTSEVTIDETITKENTSKTITKKITTNEISLKETDLRNAKQSTVRKTPMKRTRQKRIPKKCSPKQPVHVTPECSVPEFTIPEFTITVIKEDLPDEAFIQEDLGTPDGSVIEVVPYDPLSPDVLDNLDAPVVPITSDDPPVSVTSDDPPVTVTSDDPPVPVTSDDLPVPVTSDDPPVPVTSNDPPVPVTSDDPPVPVTSDDTPVPVTSVDPPVPVTSDDPPVPVIQDVLNTPYVVDDNHIPEDLDKVLSGLDKVLEEEGMLSSHVDEPKAKDKVRKGPKKITVFLNIVPVPRNRVPEGRPEVSEDNPLSLYDVPSLDDDEPVILHSVPVPKNRVPEDPVDELSSHDAPMVNNDLPVILHNAQTVNDDVTEDTDSEPMIYDECPEDTDDTVPMIYDECSEDTDDVPMINDGVTEDTCDVPSNNVPEDTVDPDVPLVREDVMDSPIMKLPMASPEPGPSGMAMQFKIYNSSSKQYDVFYCDHPMSLRRRLADESKNPTHSVGDEPVFIKKIMENTAANLERTQNVQYHPPTEGVAAERCSSDANEQVLMEDLENTAANLERTHNVQYHPPTEGVAAERCSSDADEQVLMEDLENTAANLERTQNVQYHPPTEGVAAERCSSDTDEHVHALMEELGNTADNLEGTGTRNVRSQTPTPCVGAEFRSSDVDEPVHQNAQLETPVPCAAAACRSDKDVINASKEFLDSRCEVCKPCIRIDKLMKVSALLESQMGLSSKGRQNKTDETTEREGETEDVDIEIDYEDASSADEDPGTIYLLLPKQSSIMMKLRANKLHGKDVLGVGLVPKNESLINKEFSLEEHEALLDQIIENLTIYSDVNTGLSHRTSEDRNDDTEERQPDVLDSRRVSVSSDSAAEMSDAMTDDQKTPTRLTAEKRRLKRMAVKKKLAVMHERMREEKEREIARVEEEKRREISRITAEKDSVVEQMSRYHERFNEMEKQKKRDYALLTVKIRQEMLSKLEANRKMFTEVDGIAANLDKEKDAKKMDPEELLDQDAPGTSSSILPSDGGLLVDAPVYHPTEEDFRDPLRFYEKIWPEAVRFGICKVVPPPGWKPPFRVNDEMRFDVTNQYISRLFNRWGPAARELCAIKLSLAQQKVNFSRPPLLDGVEVNLPKLYHLVQRHGGLETVYNKKRWGKVAEDMKFNKGPNTERKLDQIYVKYLLPYDTLSHQERQDIMRKVEIAWNRKHQKLLDRALNPLNRQQRLLGLIESSDDETEDEDTVSAVSDAEDCIIMGAVMNCAKFKKIATMTYENIFGQGSEAADPPDSSKIEEYYWRLVTLGTEHVCVHTAAVDTGEEGHGFIKDKSDPYGRHPWNPKMISQNQRNVLQYLGQVLGVTMPTLLLGMLFSTSCWHKDPHAVAWLEFQLLGPERIWYGIPADQADNFRKAVETLCPTSCQNKFHWLPTDITMIPPNLLREHNVTLSRVTQRDGEYILAFPNAYTCCISTGYTESESVYFAPPSWLESLWTVFKDARESCEPTMFAMEHLLYNIGKDPKADPTILKIAQPIFDKMLREEVTNRQMLQERGLPFVQELLSAGSSRKKSTAKPGSTRDQDECEYCRATLYLSKVKGLTGKNTVLCLEHALKLLDTDKYKDTDVNQLQVLVHVSVKELNNVHDDMKRRLGLPTA